jgi:hypothetical protein
MNIWVVSSQDYETWPSTHLTEGGALLNAIGEILAYLDLERIDTDETQWTDFLEDNVDWRDAGLDEQAPDIKNWREKDCGELRKIYSFLSEFASVSHYFDLSIHRTEVQP